MTRLLVSLLLVLPSTARAAEPLPPVYELAVEPESAGYQQGKTSVSIDYFRVASPVVAVGKLVSAAVRKAANADQDLRALARHDYDALDVVGMCEPGVMTNVVVSWKCGYVEVPTFPIEPNSGGAPGGTWDWDLANYTIEGARLVPITLAQVFKYTPDLTGALFKAGGVRIAPQHIGHFLITPDGLEFYSWGDPGTTAPDASIPLEKLAPLLVANHPWARMRDPVGAHDIDMTPRKPTLAPGQVRFESQDGVVVDRATGLAWAAQDNGADLTHAAAAAYCDGLKVGGKDDWRLPWIAELEVVSDVSDRHKPTGPDCVAGKYAYALTRHIALTCGMAWSADVQGNRASVMGFVSGKKRTNNLGDTKNLRALCVRSP